MGTSTMISLRDLAVKYPDRVQALVYLDAADAPGDLASRDSVLSANPVPRPQPTDSTARNRPRLLPGLLTDAGSRPSQYARTRAPILAISAVKTIDANYPWLRSSKETQTRARAQRYLDEVLNPWYARGIAHLRRERPDAHMVTLPGHHYIFLVEEQRVVDELRRFLSRDGSAQPGAAMYGLLI